MSQLRAKHERTLQRLIRDFGSRRERYSSAGAAHAGGSQFLVRESLAYGWQSYTKLSCNIVFRLRRRRTQNQQRRDRKQASLQGFQIRSCGAHDSLPLTLCRQYPIGPSCRYEAICEILRRLSKRCARGQREKPAESGGSSHWVCGPVAWTSRSCTVRGQRASLTEESGPTYNPPAREDADNPDTIHSILNDVAHSTNCRDRSRSLGHCSCQAPCGKRTVDHAVGLRAGSARLGWLEA